MDSLLSKLQGWQGKMLTMAGRMILIKHVLSSIPFHTIAATQPPSSIIVRIEKIFWG